jgi:hypothetical protein
VRDLPELQEAREDDQQDPEQHQRPDQLPEVAERRAVELQLEVGQGQRARERCEATRIVAERRRATNDADLVGAHRIAQESIRAH